MASEVKLVNWTRWANAVVSPTFGNPQLADPPEVHITRTNGSCAEAKFRETASGLWWINKFYVDERAVAKASCIGELRLMPCDGVARPFSWYWNDFND